MKVIVTTATGREEEALLDKDSGVLEFKDGEISHILFEKQFNKKIMVYVEPKKEEVKTKAPEASPEQSKAGVKKKTK